jgi:cytochrome P450
MFNVNLKCAETYPESNEITEAFAYFLQELPRRSFSQDQGVAQDYTTENEDNKKMWAASKAVHNIVLEVIRDRLAKTGGSRNDMLNRMVEAFKKEHGTSTTAEQAEKALGANLVELLFAGYNTLVNTVSSAIFELSRNPDSLKKVRDELDAVLGNKQVSADKLESLTYLTCVFKETLRLYPPAPAIARRLGKDETVGKFKIPKDAECMFSMAGLHKDPQNWEEPEKFMPERFLQPIKPGTFVPFSDGPRSCIGQHFARFEFLVIMSVLVRKFNFAPAPDYTFGMMFNGFGWMACDMKNMMAGSCVKMQVTKRPETGGGIPWQKVLLGIAVPVAVWSYVRQFLK